VEARIFNTLTTFGAAARGAQESVLGADDPCDREHNRCGVARPSGGSDVHLIRARAHDRVTRAYEKRVATVCGEGAPFAGCVCVCVRVCVCVCVGGGGGLVYVRWLVIARCPRQIHYSV
jgi:hypothetical protein